ncbi:exosome non-catalytic core subunit [Saccharomycopsis crataegensis]|uniref:Exosome non-catalytic core subunit n=1 Tax=Saccharomycopsis crataegensis TaxID=43959 RepID=A0AAV5QUB5_9ASCO|nr:exosome non-catalytic core subunit [Saccharomycopsis crataegensis]
MELDAKIGVLNNAGGSSEVSLNGIKVVCGINGPMEARPRQELPTTCYLEVIIRPAIGNPTVREKYMEDKIKNFLNSVIIGNLYPRQVIQVNLQILEKKNNNSSYTSDSDESAATEDVLLELNCCINSAFLALVDANISIYKAFNSNIFTYTHKGSLVKDGLSEAKSRHLVVYGIKNNKVDELLYGENVGRFSEKKLFMALERGEKESMILHSKLKELSVESVKQKFVYLS